MADAPDESIDQRAARAVRSIIALLVGQAVALGFTLANLIIPGSAIFLAAYGAGRLPYVYLIVAAAGSLVSMVVNRLQRRFALHHLAVGATMLVALVAAASWRLIAGSGQLWAGYVVLTLFAIHLQMGFVFIGAQVGRALDVQRIKRTFPRIVSGFVFGFMVGGFLADPLQNALGKADRLLLVSACGAVGMVVLIVLAGRVMQDPDEEPDNAVDAAPSGGATTERPPPLRALFAIPLVSSVFAYQVLSAMGTQLVDYLVYDRAVARYSGTEELTAFMGSFTAILNLTALIALVVFGAIVMARYGLRFGVGANPIVVTALIILAIGASTFLGIGSTALFVLVAIARIADITLADMATRTSVNATFQVLPPQQRLAAQVGVEGAGVPLALGLTAVLILVINAVFDSPTVPVLMATMVVCVAWCWLSFVVFGRYRAGTVLAARRRMLDEVTVDLAEPATRAALVELARSDSAADVGAAINLLAGYRSPDLGDGSSNAGAVSGLLVDAARHTDPAVAHSVLPHLLTGHPDLAAEVAVRCIEAPQKRLVIDGVQALGRLGGPPAARHLPRLVDHDDRDIAAAALAATIKVADADGSDGRTTLDQMVTSGEADDRVLAAGVIGELASADDVNRVLELVVDRDRAVQMAAATAVGALPDPAQNTIFVQLADMGDDRAIGAFLRQCAGRAGPDTCASVADWVGRATPHLAHRAVRFLGANNYRLSPSDPRLVAALQVQTSRADQAARWAASMVGTDRTEKQDELARLRRAVETERSEAQRHLIEVLGLAYDRDLMTRVGHLWSGRVDGDHAMATEALDLVLIEEYRSAVLEALADRPVDGAETCSLEAVAALARDCGWAAEPDWLQACAVSLADRTFDDLTPAGPIAGELLASTR